MRYDVSLLADQDLYLFNEGSHFRLYEKLGSHFMTVDGEEGTYFAVWAPNAENVYVTGSFNGWNKSSHTLRTKGVSGIWEGFIPGVMRGTAYKYHVVSRWNGYRFDKADPFAFHGEAPPDTGSVVWDLWFGWGDGEWMKDRVLRNGADSPISIYEAHLGSWMRVPEEGNRMLSYRELAPRLVEYLTRLNFTHVEFLPVMEHPFYGSWGYQVTGFFAPTTRYGTPQDFMFLIDTLHRHGIGVILDWVPSHFTKDGHGLNYFDGTHLFEHADPRQGHHPDWDTQIFNYSRTEVQSFLLSSAYYWLAVFHADGGRENLEAIAFLRRFNEDVYRGRPDIVTIAEESTAWPMVSRPTNLGGLGFGMKWDMGWMHDTLVYMGHDPVHRKYHHDMLSFRMVYAFSENFILSLSHDEVVHGKGSLLGKMPGDTWQKLANLRVLYGYMYGQPGKKLLFMGGEFGQRREWAHEESLEWHVLQFSEHEGLRRWVADLNRLYRAEPALHQLDFDQSGFEWVDCHDSEQSVLTFLRRARGGGAPVLVVCNFTPVPRANYIVGVPTGGYWREIANS